MSAARCAGCGEVGPCHQVRDHVLRCPAYVALYREQPEKALAPEAEWERWREEDRDAEQSAARSETLERVFARLDAKREAQFSRWTTRDLLE